MSPPLSRQGIPAIVLVATAAAGFAAALVLQWTTRSTSVEGLASQTAKCKTGVAGTAPAASGLVDRISRQRAAPGPNGYLIIGEFDFYRFTNNKIQLIEALAMAVSRG